MKKNIVLLLSISLLFLTCSQSKKDEKVSELENYDPIVLAYVSSGSDIIPDPSLVTHINYAFGYISDSLDSIIIQNPERLNQISALKKENTNLKIMLSIGGWGSGNFSEMANDTTNRKSFVLDCSRIVREFNLDGIDLDWEYPTSSASGISSSSRDKDNFTLLIQELREILGQDRLLTLASAYSAKYYDFKAIEPYIDFVNIMSYDMGRPSFHNAPLKRSEFTKNLSIEESVDAHVQAGIPINKLTLGMPFYGHGVKEINDFVDYKDLNTLVGYTEKWDSLGQVPYLIDSVGDFVYSFDNPESLRLKCEFLREKGMLGAMYWEYSCDDLNGTLRKTVYDATVRNIK